MPIVTVKMLEGRSDDQKRAFDRKSNRCRYQKQQVLLLNEYLLSSMK